MSDLTESEALERAVVEAVRASPPDASIPNACPMCGKPTLIAGMLCGHDDCKVRWRERAERENRKQFGVVR